LLVRLAQSGHLAGVHLVVATRRPAAAVLSGVLRANFPLRLVGKVVSAEDARVAAGRAQTEAHLLNGRGDFLAVGGSTTPIRFQIAYIGDQEARQVLSESQPGAVTPPPATVPTFTPATAYGGH
jgi:S-DNA-T family DNA segregation ATPase FtsK/SpoIIIE